MSWDDFYSHLVAIRNPAELTRLRYPVALRRVELGSPQARPQESASSLEDRPKPRHRWTCPPKPWRRRAALVIRQPPRISIAQGGAKLYWPLDQFLRDRRSGPPKVWRRWALRDKAESKAPMLPETKHGAPRAGKSLGANARRVRIRLRQTQVVLTHRCYHSSTSISTSGATSASSWCCNSITAVRRGS
jgi:hypothetical protein